MYSERSSVALHLSPTIAFTAVEAQLLFQSPAPRSGCQFVALTSVTNVANVNVPNTG